MNVAGAKADARPEPLLKAFALGQEAARSALGLARTRPTAAKKRGQHLAQFLPHESLLVICSRSWPAHPVKPALPEGKAQRPLTLTTGDAGVLAPLHATQGRETRQAGLFFF